MILNLPWYVRFGIDAGAVFGVCYFVASLKNLFRISKRSNSFFNRKKTTLKKKRYLLKLRLF